MYHLSMELSDYYSAKDHFIVEDLFDFSRNDAPGLDAAEDNGAFDDAVNGSSTDSSTITAGNGYGSSVSSHGQHFSAADFSQPCEEVAELEWLSNFMEDCFSNKDYHHKPIQFSNMNLNSSSSDQITTQHSAQLTNANASTVPAKTRSKRSRHIPSNWASRLPILSRTPTPTSSSDSGENLLSVPMIGNSEDGVRRCLHCGSDKTPQWRMGPMGPKTLCNACGVRYKSGRLVPEYRPVASPTFVVSEHSNSHRKVVELRRQKETQKQNQRQMLFWS